MNRKAHSGVRMYMAHGRESTGSGAQRMETSFQAVAPGEGKDKGRYKQGFTGPTGSGQRDPAGMGKVGHRVQGSVR